MTDNGSRGQRLVLLARGVGHDPRGAWFEAVHVADLLRAAGAGGMHLVEVGVGALAQLDPAVAAGQMLGPGLPAPLPPIRRTTFDALVALPPLLRAPSQVATQAATLRRSALASVQVPKQTIRVGSIVLASVAECDGWWEAEVVTIAPGNVLRLRWRSFPGLDQFDKPAGAVTVAPLRTA
jgi:hypothetical protein